MKIRCVSYNKLWDLLYSRNLSKTYLRHNALNITISSATIAKLSKDENVNMDTLIKICNLLDVDLCDIVESEVVAEYD